MNKVLGYIFSPIHYLVFGFFICLFHPIQWVCYNLGGQEAHKKSVDVLNFFLVGTYYLMGSSINFTTEKVKQLEEILKNHPDVERFFVILGGFGGNESNSAFAYVTLKSWGTQRSKKQKIIAQEIREQSRLIKGLMTIVQEPSFQAVGGGRGGGFPVEVALKGGDWDELYSWLKKLEIELEKTGIFKDIDSNYKGKVAEITIKPDRQKSLEYGVSNDEIGQTLSIALNGMIVGKFAENGRRMNVVLQLGEKDLKNLDNTLNLRVRNNRGESLPLSKVVIKAETETNPSILRLDRFRTMTLTANLTEGVALNDALQVFKEQAKKLLPETIIFQETGTSQTFRESIRSLIFVFCLGIAVAYLVLACQFNSWLDPLIIFSALPFALLGAFLGLLLMGQTLNLYSMIGLILLMGIVKKNSIILVDVVNQHLPHQKTVQEALLESCPLRLRPIMMTSVSTLIGTLPAALNQGAGSETRIPLAVTIIGGVLLSTFLTLYVVPCLYDVFGYFKKSQLKSLNHLE